MVKSENSFDSRGLNWAVLMGRWVEFARSALALPDNEVGRRMRESVADIIMLQAVSCALQHLGELDPDERALGRDRSGVLIERHIAALRARWGSRMPPALEQLIQDAQAQLRAAQDQAPGP